MKSITEKLEEKWIKCPQSPRSFELFFIKAFNAGYSEKASQPTFYLKNGDLQQLVNCNPK